MKNLLNSFFNFIKSLNTMDIIFLISLVGLIILFVSLIYIIKINDDVIVEDYEEEDDDDNIEIDIEDDVEELDLVKLSKEIEEKSSSPVNLNDYEKEQEEKAIISYDELLALKDDDKDDISYINEKNVDGLTIKSVDVDYVTKPIEIIKTKDINKHSNNVIRKTNPNKNSVLFSYEKEEAFLETLKKMQQLIN